MPTFTLNAISGVDRGQRPDLELLPVPFSFPFIHLELFQILGGEQPPAAGVSSRIIKRVFLVEPPFEGGNRDSKVFRYLSAGQITGFHFDHLLKI